MPFPEELRGKLIVSCQAFPGDPLDDVHALSRIAASAIRGGAAGLRVNSPAHVRAFRSMTDLPILGIQKRFGASPLITPSFADAAELAEAGATVIGVDCSSRRLPDDEPWSELIARIHGELGLPVLADIATLGEGLDAVRAGADAVATTLCGYTKETAAVAGISWRLVEELVKESPVPVIVEGRVGTPEEARKALEMGAFAVVVGAAISHPEWITARFVEAMRV